MFLHTNLTNMHVQFSQFYVILFFICEGWSDLEAKNALSNRLSTFSLIYK